ncbi:putative house-cleaning noncanonical NTP pyrophosphatase (MazG superfamily) [Paenibacillus endophyticus]|uniref:Putative house-cleaning noncanonical NTP pyrophosphatase (MazG superfamily) n=1 Tax=Paenibacillus endophyticus TaxID=1294268 RepID=A0A7W5CB56_9BACL|nr:nucleoside triphosphate pyrophosphohydrolase [Paenibacillus endophyticus]MBB3154476.1 putative house-cleaning noncanonical NTP pyrophosphatase (MazG superfamily) [Paenibacillus endophyticus]
MITYNKLVRDKVPHIIEASGKTSVIRVLDKLEMGNALKSKMQEELNEFLEATSVEDQVSELADLVEVIYGILDNEGISLEEFEKRRRLKIEQRGGFERKLFLISVIENDKERIFKQYNSKEELIAREIDKYISEHMKNIKIKLPMTDCIGYKIADSKKFASLTIQDNHSLILHIGKKQEMLGTKLQEEIDMVLGGKFPRTQTDNNKYSHQAFIKLEWVNDIEQIKPFIRKAYDHRTQN